MKLFDERIIGRGLPPTERAVLVEALGFVNEVRAWEAENGEKVFMPAKTRDRYEKLCAYLNKLDKGARRRFLEIEKARGVSKP